MGIKVSIALLLVALTMAPPLLVQGQILYHPERIDITQEESAPSKPSMKHWLGTDRLHRDVLSRLWHGAGQSVLIAGIASLLLVIVGALIGGYLGYKGHRWDMIGQRVVEGWEQLPLLYTLLVLASILKTSTIIASITIMVIAQWTMLIPLIRTQTLRMKEEVYINYSRAIGAQPLWVIRKHIAPNIAHSIKSSLPWIMAGNIGLLTTWEYLGIRLDVGKASLGSMLDDGLNNLDYPWLWIPPLIVMLAIVWGCLSIKGKQKENHNMNSR